MILAKINLSEVKVEPSPQGHAGPNEPALTAIEEALRSIQAAVAAEFARDAMSVSSQPALQRYNAWARSVARPTITIRTPADVGAFLGRAYVAGVDNIQSYSDEPAVEGSIANFLTAIRDGEATAHAGRLMAGVNGMSRAILIQLGNQLDAVDAAIRDAAKPEVRQALSQVPLDHRD
jgi:hypothetical protein